MTHIISLAVAIVLFSLSLNHTQQQPAAPLPTPPQGPDPWPRIPAVDPESYRDDTAEVIQ